MPPHLKNNGGRECLLQSKGPKLHVQYFPEIEHPPICLGF
jgi:hypothetical protein